MPSLRENQPQRLTRSIYLIQFFCIIIIYFGRVNNRLFGIISYGGLDVSEHARARTQRSHKFLFLPTSSNSSPVNQVAYFQRLF